LYLKLFRGYNFALSSADSCRLSGVYSMWKRVELGAAEGASSEDHDGTSSGHVKGESAPASSVLPGHTRVTERELRAIDGVVEFTGLRIPPDTPEGVYCVSLRDSTERGRYFCPLTSEGSQLRITVPKK
jgi:hypothetical protein